MASTDSIEDNTGFAEKNRASFPILSDVSKDTALSYGVLGGHGYANRWTFYIDPDGVIVLIDKEVSPRTAGRDLVANLQALKVAPIQGE
jgi:peroxiredoxin Q/BCP|tara:strand:+ start:1112 stop:1378 length:267 start_codon:yes stop_codon:yes gene_type:complete